MSILRRDPTSYAWTIYPEEDFAVQHNPCCDEITVGPEDCPFCGGHEGQTPPEIVAVRASNTPPNRPGWRVRTIPDRSAVLRIEGKLERRGEGLYDMMNGVGAHEIIVETPEHTTRFSQLPEDWMRDVVWMYRERMRDLLRDNRFHYVQVCRNYGVRAGARLPHPHSLVIALPVVPPWVREEVSRAQEYWQMKERCISCDILAQEAKGERIVYENVDFVVLEPFAARSPFETWILPREHKSRFDALDDAQLPTLADALRRTVTGLEGVLKDPPYNLIVHTSPPTMGRLYNTAAAPLADYYHWHIEIIPRLRELNGFEYGTGISVNPVLPEAAAQQLRKELKSFSAGGGASAGPAA